MDKYIEVIKRVCELEESNDIYTENISGIPIWLCVYRKYRDRYIDMESGVPPMSNHGKLNLLRCVKTTFKSAYQFFSLILRKKETDNVIYGFPRLESIEGIYVDKFCDELIRQTQLADSYLYFERSRSFNHLHPRGINNIVWTEFIDNLCIILGYVGIPITYLSNKSIFESLFKKVTNLVPLTLGDKKFIVRKVGSDLIKYHLTSNLFRRLKVKRIFAPVLRNFPYLVAAAKELNIPCFEIQHGITEGPTPLYSGTYLHEFSPTAFLAFGNTSMIPVFNVPMEKMVNIGFAYKQYLYKRSPKEILKNHYLFVSDPEITQYIIDVVCEIKKDNPECEFTIRFHPLEKPSDSQIAYLKENGVSIDDGKENSTLAIMKYEGILGEKSTVLYEALNFGKKVAKISYNKLNVNMDVSEETKKGFCVLSGIEEFKLFKKADLRRPVGMEFYSDFKKDAFAKILLLSNY